STASSSNAERTEQTRGKLIAAGRELFGQRGYNSVSTEQIVQRAQVTRGALYHHFGDKRDLFREVAESVEADATKRAAEAALAAAKNGDQPEAWQAALNGSRAFLDICLEPEFQRIMIVDAPSVLGQAELTEIADRHGGALIEGMLTALIEAKLIKPLAVRPLARVLTGALINGGLTIAESDDQNVAREEVGTVIEALLDGLAERE
ncbi:MAG: TetR/AcrR family transcriptional regulator, partial [Solirubrobacterales bacterium]